VSTPKKTGMVKISRRRMYRNIFFEPMAGVDAGCKKSILTAETLRNAEIYRGTNLAYLCEALRSQRLGG